jgi:hypothetical protein
MRAFPPEILSTAICTHDASRMASKAPLIEPQVAINTRETAVYGRELANQNFHRKSLVQSQNLRSTFRPTMSVSGRILPPALVAFVT